MIRNATKTHDTIDLIRQQAAKASQEVFMQSILSQFTFPSRPGSDGRWYIKVPDITCRSGRKTIAAKSLEDLKGKVLDHVMSSGDTRTQIIPDFQTVYDMVQARFTQGIKDPAALRTKQNSVKRHYQTYKRYIEGTRFEQMPVDQITPQDIMRLCENAVQKHDLKNHELTSLRTAIKSVMEYSQEVGFVPNDRKNAYELANFRVALNGLSDPAAIVDRSYTQSEINTILEAISDKHHNAPDYLPAYALELQFYLGLRRGEVAAIMWSDIQNGSITIRRSLKSIKSKGSPEEFYISKTKNGKVRSIPITPTVQALLDKIRKIQILTARQSVYVFPGDTDPGCISLNSVYEFFARLCKANGIQMSKDLIRGTHALRRNFVTDTRNTGAGIDVASYITGHTPDVDDANYYAGPEQSQIRDILIAAGR